MRDLVDRMLAMIDRRSWSIDGSDQAFCVNIADLRIAFDIATPAIGLAFEQLAMAIEATIAAGRARRMIVAAGMGSQPLPPWLVSGTDVLADTSASRSQPRAL